MEPVSLILSALATGAGKAASDVYDGLKTLVQRKFAGNPSAELMLAEYEKDPEASEALLKKKLEETGAVADTEILKAAQLIAQQYKPRSSTQVTFEGEVKGAQIGDHNTQTNTFGDLPGDPTTPPPR